MFWCRHFCWGRERWLGFDAKAVTHLCDAAITPLHHVNRVLAHGSVTSYHNEGRDRERVVNWIAEQSPVRELHRLQENKNTHTYTDKYAAPIHTLIQRCDTGKAWGIITILISTTLVLTSQITAAGWANCEVLLHRKGGRVYWLYVKIGCYTEASNTLTNSGAISHAALALCECKCW